jgi:hypothetical protein
MRARIAQIMSAFHREGGHDGREKETEHDRTPELREQHRERMDVAVGVGPMDAARACCSAPGDPAGESLQAAAFCIRAVTALW